MYGHQDGRCFLVLFSLFVVSQATVLSGALGEGYRCGKRLFCDAMLDIYSIKQPNVCEDRLGTFQNVPGIEREDVFISAGGVLTFDSGGSSSRRKRQR